jgi:hypothetical protein
MPRPRRRLTTPVGFATLYCGHENPEGTPPCKYNIAATGVIPDDGLFKATDHVIFHVMSAHGGDPEKLRQDVTEAKPIDYSTLQQEGIKCTTAWLWLDVLAPGEQPDEDLFYIPAEKLQNVMICGSVSRSCDKLHG